LIRNFLEGSFLIQTLLKKTASMSVLEFHQPDFDFLTESLEPLVSTAVKSRFTLRFSAEVNRARFTQMRRNDAAFRADKPQGMTCVRESKSSPLGLLFDVLADSVLAGTSRLHTGPALIEGEIIKSAVEFLFSLPKMFVNPLRLSAFRFRSFRRVHHTPNSKGFGGRSKVSSSTGV
jgi:hypothetical protein